MKNSAFMWVRDKSCCYVNATGAFIEKKNWEEAGVTSSFPEAELMLVPSEQVLLIQTTLPKLPAYKLRQAAIFAIEEQLSEELEAFHIVIGKRNKAGEVPIAAVNQALLKTWISLQKTLSPLCRIVIPEALALPYQPNQWTVLATPDRVFIRLSAVRGTAVAWSQFPVFCKLLLRSEKHPEQIVWLSTGELSEFPSPEELFQGIALQRPEAVSTPEAVFAEGLISAQIPFNLLEYATDFQEKPSQKETLWRWILAGAGLLVGGIWLSTEAAILRALEHRNDTVQLELLKLYRQIYPDLKEATGLKSRLEQSLKEFSAQATQKGSNSFLEMTASISNQLKMGNYPININKLDYNGKSLLLDVTAPDFGVLTKFSDDLKPLEYVTEQTNSLSKSTPEKSEISARLTISYRKKK